MFRFATLLLSCTPALVLAGNWCCDESQPCMSADIEGQREPGYPYWQFDAQVWNIPWGEDWIKGCWACGNYLENASQICPGWYCESDGTGVWLQRHGPYPTPAHRCGNGNNNLKTNNTHKITAKTYFKKK